ILRSYSTIPITLTHTLSLHNALPICSAQTFALGAVNMTELPPQLRQVRDFFFKQALALSPERTYLHQPELIKNQTIFRLEDLRRSEEHTSELQSRFDIVCRHLLAKKK